jgi:DNA-binding transcriptional LysR family regulator
MLVRLDEGINDPGFITVASRPEPLAFVTYPDNPLLKKKKLSIRDAVSSDFIITSREIGYSAMLERRLSELGLSMDPVMDIGSVEAIIRIIRGGYGVACLPQYVISDYVDRNELVTLDTGDHGINMNSYFLCSSERWINPAMKEFVRVVNMVESYSK